MFTEYAQAHIGSIEIYGAFLKFRGVNFYFIFSFAVANISLIRFN